LNKRLSTKILASEAVVEDLDHLLVRPVGYFKLVGKSRALPIWEVICKREMAGESALDLCERFAAALDVYLSEQWSRAAHLFETIVSDYPTDGPSRFYLTQCQQDPRRVIEVKAK
jgi:adenylate cyclase